MLNDKVKDYGEEAGFFLSFFTVPFLLTFSLKASCFISASPLSLGLSSFLRLTRLCVATGNDTVKARGWLLQAGLVNGDVVLSAQCHLTQEHVANVMGPAGHASNWGTQEGSG